MDPKLRETYERYAKLREVNIFTGFVASSLVRAVRASFVDLHVVGDVPKETSIFVPYHVTSIDSPLIGQYLENQRNYAHGLMDIRAFRRHPLLNSLLGEVPFDPSIKSKSSFKWSIKEIKYWLNEGKSVIIFDDGPSVKNNKKILEEKIISDLHARIAKKTEIQIVPVAPHVFRPEEIYIWQGKTTWKELARRWRLDYFLGFGEPVNPSDYETPRELAEEVKRRQISMHEDLIEMEKEHREGTYSWVKHIGASLKKRFRIGSPKI